MTGDRDAPRADGDERRILLAFLEYLRDAVVRKAEGVPEPDVRRAMVPSGTSLLGLVKHLTRAEVAWFQWAFAGLEVRIPDDEPADDDSPAAVIGAYRAEVARSNAIVAACDDLSGIGRRPIRTPAPMSLRWVLVHMIEETGRHAGHADILREQIDGTVGR